MSGEREVVELVADVTGSGPVTVLLHGIAEDARTWEPLREPLAEDATVIAVDLRGHGRSPQARAYDPDSMAADVRALLRRLGRDDDAPLVVGHSMGGLVAAAYAAAHPARAVVVVDQPLDLAASQPRLRELEPQVRGEGFEELITGLFEAMRGPLPATEVERVSAIRRPRRSVALGVWAPLFDLEPTELDAWVGRFLAGVQVPLFSLHGNAPRSGYEAWLRTRVPTAQLEVWDEHGHYPHLVDPDRFVARVRRFDPPG